MSIAARRKPLLARLFTYQAERFPLLVHGLLITAFSFSAISYSRLCRGLETFIEWKDFLACVFTNLTLFFLLRVSDEHKDKEDDAKFRAYLPVPRGLVSLKELRGVAFTLLSAATLINVLWYRPLLPLYGATMGYLLLMRYEFWIPRWLRRHQIAYNLSHMLIIPLADIYASGYDWRLASVEPPYGLLFFFGVSYLNGLVLEVGRKMRAPESEEPGVVSYTGIWGTRFATKVWSGLLMLNFGVAWAAATRAGHSETTKTILVALVFICLIPSILFWAQPRKRWAKSIEIASLLWALGMYLLLGGVPMLASLLRG